jgi:hypothetical protein
MMAEKSNMTPFKGAIYDAPKRGFPMLAVTIVNGVVEARPVRSRSGRRTRPGASVPQAISSPTGYATACCPGASAEGFAGASSGETAS